MYLVTRAAFMHNHRSYHPGVEIGTEIPSERRAALVKAGKARYQDKPPEHPTPFVDEPEQGESEEVPEVPEVPEATAPRRGRGRAGA